MTTPLLSVCITTYNHKDFISKALDSALMQKTTFDIEICLGEDESNDGTREICSQYAEKYPDKIRLFLRNRDDVIYVDGTPTGRFNFIETLKQCKGKYIALLDGDDFWTDSNKLQKQIDILEMNPDVSMASHNAEIYSELSGKIVNHLIPYDHDGEIPESMVVERSNGPIPTSSIIIRSNVKDELVKQLPGLPVGDYYIAIYCLLFGKIFHINQAMSVYRVNSNSWTGRKKSAGSYITHHYLHEKALTKFNNITNSKFKKNTNAFFEKKTYELFNNLIRIGFIKSYFKHRNYLNGSLKHLQRKAYYKLTKTFINKQFKTLLGKNN